MIGPDTPPERDDEDWTGDETDMPAAVLPEAHSVTLVCPECSEFVRIRDVHAYVLSNHLAVCREMALLNGDSD